MKFETEIRVRYAETDAMGVVYHGNYFVWMEVGRTEFFRHLGLPYSQVEQQGIYFPVVEAHCKYLRPASYDDHIIVETQVERFSAARVVFKYRIYLKENQTSLVEGQTVHAFVNKQGKPINIKKVPELQQKLIKIKQPPQE